MKNHTAKIAELAVFTAVAFIFSYIESLIPLPIPFPGIKLGLANLIILIVLYRDGFRSALGVSMTRNVLNALTFGSLFGLFYSVTGSILSLTAMAALKKMRYLRLSKVSISSIGGILHNMGQFATATAIVGFDAIAHYFPLLYFSGLIAGCLIGILSELCIQKLKFL